MDETYTFFPPAIAQVNRQYQHQQVDRALKSAENATVDPSDPALKAACQEMESLFVNHLFKEMRATIQKSGLISGGRAEEIFTSMLDTELSSAISASRGIGLAEILFKQLSGYSVQRPEAESE
ncbi:MAG: rod-binding protein [Desulfobacterales bacterium]|nr:rod-binding protein [Desulfobacterales bacterium]